MKKVLVIAEKPSVGRDIARVLGCTSQKQGYFEGDKYIVTWALGHLVTLADPEAYDKRFATWRLEDLPIMPAKMKLIVMKGSGKQFSTIKGLVERRDLAYVVIATDAGREGELVARWILYKAHSKLPMKRLWISSVTDKAIRDGFKNLRNAGLYDNLFHAAEARAHADWIVGINASRALTTKYNAQLSCGRVQTPTLAMVAQRDEAIKAFKPKAYYEISAVTEKGTFKWADHHGNTQTFSKEKAEGIKAELVGMRLEVSDVKSREIRKFAPELYDLTTLQMDAHKAYGYSAKMTLSIMQRLYEQHKVLTYPRTDSRYLTADMVDTLEERIKACGVGPFSSAAFKILRGGIKPSGRFVDDKKVSDHHAIVPTEESPFLGSLDTDERRIYEMVVQRFLAVFMPPYVTNQTTVQAKAGKHVFSVKGSVSVSQGWHSLYGNEKTSEDSQLGSGGFKVGDRIEVGKYQVKEGHTAPPPLFNEGTLLKAMESPVQYLDVKDSDYSRILGETGGIGTVATRADIIEKLFSSFLIEQTSLGIRATSKGKQLLNLVPEALKSPDLTAEWELKLNAIAKGHEKKEDFVKEMRTFTKSAVAEIEKSAKTYKHDNLTREKCPECGKYLLKVKGKRGELYVCQDRDCGYRKSISRVTNARCPNCHKKMKMVGQGEGKKFVCKCGYSEKLSSFNKRKKEEGKKGNMKDVRKYMKSNDSDAPFNTAMADKLKDLFK